MYRVKLPRSDPDRVGGCSIEDQLPLLQDPCNSDNSVFLFFFFFRDRASIPVEERKEINKVIRNLIMRNLNNFVFNFCILVGLGINDTWLLKKQRIN